MTTCGYCGATEKDHPHFAVLVLEHGRLLGRLTPAGTTTNRNIFAAVLDRESAERIAAEIDAGGQFTAKVIPF